MSPAVSVIVPAYNAESFLPEALEAVFAQTFSDWELILVDDGSTDSTPALCDGAARRDPRIKVIHKPNGGLSSARNAGLDRASGRFIYFMDADDLIPPHALRTLVGTAESTGAQLVLAPFKAFGDGRRPKFRTPRPSVPRLLSGAGAAEAGMYQRLIDNGICGKLYDRTLWESPGIRFTDGILYEDLDVFYRVWPRAAKAALLSEPLYGYRQHFASIIHTFSRRRLDALDVTDRMVGWIAENLPALLPAARDRRMSAHFNILLLMYRNGVTDPAAEARCIRLIRREAPASLKNSRVRPKNRLGALAYILGRRPALRAMSRLI